MNMLTYTPSKLCFIIISNEYRHCGNKEKSFINDTEEIPLNRYPKTPNDSHINSHIPQTHLGIASSGCP